MTKKLSSIWLLLLLIGNMAIAKGASNNYLQKSHKYGGLLRFYTPQSANSSDLFFKYGFQILAGYQGGFNLQGNLLLTDFAKDFPFSIKIGYGFTRNNPGDALDARHIFINNNSNGTPEKKGTNNDFKMEFLYPTKIFKVKRSYLYGGIRYSHFIGNFNFVGGNENFDVIQNTWGIASGIEFHFPINKKTFLTMNSGMNYYFPNALIGHDTTYTPDGDNINPRKDYNYEDADNAINQPKFQLQAKIGLTLKI